MTKHVSIADECEEPTQENITTETVIKEVTIEDTDDEDENYDGSEESDFEPQMDFGQLLSNFFVTENGVNVADAIMELKESLDIHNKLLHKYIKSKLST